MSIENKNTVFHKGLAARPWNIQTIHDALKRCKNNPQSQSDLFMQAGQMATDFFEYVKEELEKIPSLNPEERKELVQKVNAYNQRLFEWLRDGHDKESLDFEERVGLTLEYSAIIEQLEYLQKSTLDQGGEDEDNEDDEASEIKKRFTFGEAQAFFDNKDLDLPGSADLDPVKILKTLVDSFGIIVEFKKLDENSNDKASGFLRNKVRDINDILEKNNIPCKIEPKKYKGYVLRNTQIHS